MNVTTPTITRQIDGPEGTLHVDDGGTGGTPVVLIHSFGGSTAQWSPQLEHLRGTRRAVAFDLRGHGDSEAPRDGDYSVESMASDLGAVVNGLGLEKVVLVGHGLGAKVAIEYAGTAPERVAGLLMAVAPARISPEQATQMRTALEADYDKTSEGINQRLLTGASDDVRAVIVRDARKIPPDAGLRIIEASFEHDPVPALRRYPGPKLAVTSPDADTPNDLHNLVDGIAHETLAGTSHWMELDKPDEFNRIVDRFLERIGGPS
jgi:pimeloyl-ACP methyl ester carboxylesterase